MTELEKLAVEHVQAKEKLQDLTQEFLAHVYLPDYTSSVGDAYVKAIDEAKAKVNLTYAAMASHVKAAYPD